eukprot:TRINITY_DN56516_c0_g1_i1.p1 TRINITY_DN56516_c0_g1~~TRINITY_DN56516_c0_g1_i1.p1  ORF type:complete len:531 (+),score=152.94 TRINITY_DN56516_c0_g1_i1:92-1684(+)
MAMASAAASSAAHARGRAAAASDPGLARLRGLLASLDAKTSSLAAATADASARLGEAAAAYDRDAAAAAALRRRLGEAKAELQDAEAARRASEREVEKALSGAAFLRPRALRNRPPEKVAACLLLRPSLLGEFPGVLLTYLEYHFLAQLGPQLSHVIICVHEAVRRDEDAAAARVRHVLEVNTLTTRVTVLQASLLMEDQGTTKASVGVRAAAARGELIAIQMLNMQRSLEIVAELGMDWLLCNLDVDEAVVVPSCSSAAGSNGAGGIGALLARLPADVVQAVVLNHEAVPETSEETDYFHTCTLVKLNPNSVSAATPEEQRCLAFWRRRIVAASVRGAASAEKQEENENKADAAVADTTMARLHFAAYANGKSAVRVGACLERCAAPLGSHRWRVPEDTEKQREDTETGMDLEAVQSGAAAAVLAEALDPEEVFILHYSNCEGVKGFSRKYSARVGEQWNTLPHHRLCQDAARAGAGAEAALRRTYEEAVALTDLEEIERQVASGICRRFYDVREACSQLNRARMDRMD